MKNFISVLLVLISLSGIGQKVITYPTVFAKGTELVNDLSFKITIQSDSANGIQSFVLQEFIQDSILSHTWNITVTKSQVKFNEGHIGTLFHGFNKQGEGFFIYMMDNYCILNKLPKGKTNYSNSETVYTLMSGK